MLFVLKTWAAKSLVIWGKKKDAFLFHEGLPIPQHSEKYQVPSSLQAMVIEEDMNS